MTGVAITFVNFLAVSTVIGAAKASWGLTLETPDGVYTIGKRITVHKSQRTLVYVLTLGTIASVTNRTSASVASNEKFCANGCFSAVVEIIVIACSDFGASETIATEARVAFAGVPAIGVGTRRVGITIGYGLRTLVNVFT
jgi:hypothetical protein